MPLQTLVVSYDPGLAAVSALPGRDHGRTVRQTVRPAHPAAARTFSAISAYAKRAKSSSLPS